MIHQIGKRLLQVLGLALGLYICYGLICFLLLFMRSQNPNPIERGADAMGATACELICVPKQSDGNYPIVAHHYSLLDDSPCVVFTASEDWLADFLARGTKVRSLSADEFWCRQEVKEDALRLGIAPFTAPARYYQGSCPSRDQKFTILFTLAYEEESKLAFVQVFWFPEREE